MSGSKYNAPFKVVALGGGTGLSVLLRGLKKYVPRTADPEPHDGPVIGDLTAIVTVSDDGGSSGRLRREFSMLAPGDVRNCIVALSPEEEVLSRLFQYRFRAGAGLEGHNFGNLFLLALTEITGDFAAAVKLSSDVLATRGRIYPATTHNVEIEAIMDDGSTVQGETRITASKKRIVELRMIPRDAEPLPAALQAIQEADLITMGPGSLFTSLIPNMLVRAIPPALAKSKAVKVYVGNLMTQANESLGLTASQHIQAIYNHSGPGLFDYALLNSTPASRELKARYAEEGQEQIEVDLDRIRALGVKPLMGEYLEIGPTGNKGVVARHDTDRVARDLMRIAVEARKELTQKV